MPNLWKLPVFGAGRLRSRDAGLWRECPPGASTIVPARFWPAGRALALADLEGENGLTVVALVTPPGNDRGPGRRLAREALRDLLGAFLSMAPEQVPLDIVPGRAPRLAWAPGHGSDRPATGPGMPPVGMSISHESGLSLAAIRAGGPVGVDLMALPDLAGLPDWPTLARDYLGPAATKVIGQAHGTESQARADAFAQAWTAREAWLKSQGQALREWTAVDDGLPNDERRARVTRPVGLPPGWRGSVCWSAGD